MKQDSGSGAALKSKDTPKTCRVRFWLKFHVDYGQSIKIIGSHQDLGEARGMAGQQPGVGVVGQQQLPS